MQVKRAIQGALLHNYQYITNTRACVESPHYFFLFSNCRKDSTTGLRPLYITFSLRCECSTFSYVPVFLAMHRDLPFIGTENIYE